ncbi:hypothetical protein N7495_007691 [Penicillium taxi]|uniref:uncharacterized protein n=1 Tax=Penicillium taxi TaxID=168475 RepID=UPI002544E5F4|nr:uncharacterized protein N7495_007691 [Penicillium taxi]KAJ5887650.1 hypothetical protein N7495_007691 [Penicillium taxi]
MSSYFSSFTSSASISTALGSRLTSLRRAITLGDEGDDPENEDSSHISNALRAYYIEKGQPFPPWLPPDPKAPVAAPSRMVATTHGQPASPAAYGRGGGGGLGDLWGDSGASAAPQAQTASLRRGRNGNGMTPPTLTASAPPGSAASSPPPLLSANSHSPSLHPTGTRPLPSQRAGSYQSSPAGRGPERAGSAQERLRARLHGGRSPSPNVDPSVRKPVGSSGRAW